MIVNYSTTFVAGWFIRGWMEDAQDQGAGSVWEGRLGRPVLWSLVVIDPIFQIYTLSPGQLSQLTTSGCWTGEETGERNLTFITSVQLLIKSPHNSLS